MMNQVAPAVTEKVLDQSLIWICYHLDRIRQNSTYLSEHETTVYVHVQSFMNMYMYHVQTRL
jgi:hypothetical protein